jgi:hypothetical protein
MSGRGISIPRISFIQWFVVLFAKSPIFRLEILLPMMFRLIAYVFPYRRDVAWADAEFAIASLPRKIEVALMLIFYPTGGRRFDPFDNFCRCVVFGLCKKYVNMVTHRIYFNQLRVIIIQDAVNISMELAALLIAQQRTPVLGAEYEVNDNVSEGLGHRVSPFQGLVDLWGDVPGPALV